MTGTKVLLILLILIVVLFVVFIAWGAFGSSASDKTTSSTFDPGSYPVIGNLGNLFGSPSPKLKPSELTPNPSPLRRVRVPSDKFVLRAGDQPTTFDISADSDHQLRRGVFSITRQRCAQIEYESSDANAGHLKKQPWPHNPYATDKSEEWLDKDNPTKVTLQILSAKGRLTITIQQLDCVVQLE
jgi:hypothetical protein